MNLNNEQQFISILDDEGNPCNTCLIRSTCKRSFINGSACDEFWDYTYKRLRIVRNEIKE
jgi:hypothetical protein